MKKDLVFLVLKASFVLPVNFFLSEVTLASRVNLIKHLVPSSSNSAGWFYCIVNWFINSSVLEMRFIYWCSNSDFPLLRHRSQKISKNFGTPKFEVVKWEVDTDQSTKKTRMCAVEMKTNRLFFFFFKCVFQFSRYCWYRCRESDRQHHKACIATEALTEAVILSLFYIFDKIFHSVTPKRNVLKRWRAPVIWNHPTPMFVACFRPQLSEDIPAV